MTNILPYSKQVSFLIEIGIFLIVYTIYITGIRGLNLTNILLTFFVFSIWIFIIILINSFYNELNFPVPITSRSSYNF